MLKPGDEITLFYNEGEGLTESPGYRVIEYDNGLLKVYKPAGKKGPLDEQLKLKREDSKPEIFNVRSINFFKIEIKD